jgi:hypothetical protein
MAYTKNTWKTGDIVSSQKLNHMEDGIANSENVFIVGGATIDGNGDPTGTLDKTWQEIHDAMQSKICVATAVDGDTCAQWRIFVARAADAEYEVRFDTAISTAFSTDSKDGYPSSGGK